MAHPHPYAVDQSRPRLTAAVMAGLFIAALMAAWFLAVRPKLSAWHELLPTRPVEAGELVLNAPNTWTFTPPGQGADEQLVRHTGTLSAPTSGASIWVGLVQTATTQAASEVIEAAVNQRVELRGRRSVVPLESPAKFRVGRYLGTRFTFLITGRSRQRVTRHVFVTLTENGRRFWILDFQVERTDVPTAKDRRTLDADTRFLLRMVETSEDRGLRNATAEDLRRAGLLVPAEATDVSVRVDVHEPAGSPVDVTFAAEDTLLRSARVLNVSDTGRSDPEDPLSPAASLRRQFEDTVGRPPTDDEVWEKSNDRRQIWGITYPPRSFEDIDSEGMLRRMTCYVRLSGSKQGTLIDLSGEVEINDWLDRIGDLLVAGEEHEAFDAMARRGATLAGQMRASTRTYVRPGPAYYLITRGPIPLGAAMESVRTSLETADKIEGKTIVLSRHLPNKKTSYQWSSSLDGVRFSWLRVNPDPEKLHILGYEITGDGHDLAMQHVTMEQERQAGWNLPQMEGFVSPIVEGCWPMAWLADESNRRAVLWTCREDKPPAPMMVDWTLHEDGTPPTVRMRPLGAIAADRLEFSAAGEFITRYDGESGNTLRVVTREQLLARYPELVTQVNAWEEQHEQKP